jgi:hypothetical protein
LLNSGQLGGVDIATATELINRSYDDSGKRIKLQDKDEYKALFRCSPDLGDASCMLTEVARIRGLRLLPVGETVNKIQDVSKRVETANAVYEQADYVGEEEYDTEMEVL